MLVELSVMEQRYQAVMAMVQDGWTVTEVARRLGVARQSVHNWIARYEAGGLPALADRSPRPESCAHQVAPEIEALICELRRKHPHWGPPPQELDRLRDQLSAHIAAATADNRRPTKWKTVPVLVGSVWDTQSPRETTKRREKHHYGREGKRQVSGRILASPQFRARSQIKLLTRMSGVRIPRGAPNILVVSEGVR